MSEEEIDHLSELVRTRSVVYIDAGGGMHPISCVMARADEPSRVAMFVGRQGRYMALYTCELSDFRAVELVS